MGQRTYYSIRTGKNPLARFDLPSARKLFAATYRDFDHRDYFQEAFGYECVDVGFVPGTTGLDIKNYFLLHLRKVNLWPILDKHEGYTEDDLFDIIEFLFDRVSKPTDKGENHFGYDSDIFCGTHHSEFDKAAGRIEFRSAINTWLKDYGEGYELSDQGEIVIQAESGLESLLEASLPVYDEKNVESRIEAAVQKYRRSRGSLDDRRDAVRSLADVLEFLKPKLKSTISSADESDLFHLANQFGIRHHNEKQKTKYDQTIWLSWMFYYYLATIHAALRLLQRKEK